MEIGWENLYLDLGAQRVNEIQAEIQMEISINPPSCINSY